MGYVLHRALVLTSIMFTVHSHNTLKNFVGTMCKEAGFQDYKTNHSLRTMAATILDASGVDEQLLMERSSHRSVEGIRSEPQFGSTSEDGLSRVA